MYKISVPISFRTQNSQSRPLYAEAFQKCGVERIFLHPMAAAYAERCVLNTDPGKAESDIRYYQEQGFETGVWINGFGHGGPLADEFGDVKTLGDFSELEGVDGVRSYAMCPLNQQFSDCYMDSLRRIAAMHPDLIMIDDDFRLNMHRYNMGCCCELHLKEYHKRIGQEIPREELERKVFSGGKNRYRTEWLKLMGETLLSFARKMRAAVDEVDPSIRMGACMCWDTWDYDGIDGIELARILAGNTRPFLRTIGAPYHDVHIAFAVENTRMQAAWCRNMGIEVFAEGDVYPRPRYNLPARQLELYDLALLALGETDGILKYMFDYSQPIEYEKGYMDRHIKNTGIRREIADIFEGKKAVGVRIYDVMRKTENCELPAEPASGIANHLSTMIPLAGKSKGILIYNGIPTAYEGGYGEKGQQEGPVLLFGENARYISEKELSGGAILDVGGAGILKERGIDVGLIRCGRAEFLMERFAGITGCPGSEGTVYSVDGAALSRMELAEGARVLSWLEPESAPGAYLYENSAGQRFFVLACDFYAQDHKENTNYTNSYYRSAQMKAGIAWAGRKPLPAVCTGKNPFLYMIASESVDKQSLAVALFNTFPDDAAAPEIHLSRSYTGIRFVNCSGELRGDMVVLTDIEPYGFVAFEVTGGHDGSM